MSNQGYPAIPFNDLTQPQNLSYAPYSPNFPQQGYPPPQQGYDPAIQQGYVAPTQQGFAPPPQQGYPHPQQGYPQPPPYAPQYPHSGYAPPQPGPIVQQPGSYGGPPPAGAAGWMNIPQGPANCPPGLEYLTMIDQLLVHQKVELLEALIGFETNNKFTIKNSIGQKVYHAVEDNDCFTRNCCGPMRPFEMKILDNFQNQVINLHRPLACESCCFPCCLQTMEVTAPPGTVIGSIEQEWSICSPSFVIKNAAGEAMLRIKGPMCRFTICGDVEFKILSHDGETVVGKITKQWSGLLREMFTDADYFGITFPLDMDVKMKAVLLGALFLIDAMFFEKAANQESDRPGMF